MIASNSPLYSSAYLVVSDSTLSQASEITSTFWLFLSAAVSIRSVWRFSFLSVTSISSTPFLAADVSILAHKAETSGVFTTFPVELLARDVFRSISCWIFWTRGSLDPYFVFAASRRASRVVGVVETTQPLPGTLYWELEDVLEVLEVTEVQTTLFETGVGTFTLRCASALACISLAAAAASYHWDCAFSKV